MSYIVTYDKTLGRIHQIQPSDPTQRAWEGADLALDRFKSLLGGIELDIMHVDQEVSPVLHYVDLNTFEVKRKTPFPKIRINNGNFRDIPWGTDITWPDGVKTMETSEFQFECNVGGTFTFILDNPLHELKTVEIVYNV